MLKVEDVTLDQPEPQRVFTIRGTEKDFDKLCEALRTAQANTPKNQEIIRQFHHMLESHCCW